MEYSKFEDLRYELRLVREKDREIVLEGLFSDGDKVIKALEKFRDANNVNTPKNPTGDVYRIFVNEYDTGKNSYTACNVLSGIKMCMNAYNEVIEKAGVTRLAHFISNYIIKTVDGSSMTRGLLKKEKNLIDRVEKTEKSINGMDKISYTAYFKDGSVFLFSNKTTLKAQCKWLLEDKDKEDENQA